MLLNPFRTVLSPRWFSRGPLKFPLPSRSSCPVPRVVPVNLTPSYSRWVANITSPNRVYAGYEPYNLKPGSKGIKILKHLLKGDRERRGQNTRQDSTRHMKTSRSVVHSIIAANIAVYGLFHSIGKGKQGNKLMWDNFSVSYAGLAEGRYWTLFTAMVSQQGFLHLALNNVVLWSFGIPLCHTLGPKRFLTLFVSAGLVANMTQVAYNKYAVPWLKPDPYALPSMREHLEHSRCLGMSGPVLGVMSVCTILNPASTIYLYGIVGIPLWVGFVGFLGLDFLAFSTAKRDGVGHAAHVGGAMTGVAYYYYVMKANARRIPFRPTGRR